MLCYVCYHFNIINREIVYIFIRNIMLISLLLAIVTNKSILLFSEHIYHRMKFQAFFKKYAFEVEYEYVVNRQYRIY